MEPLAYIPELQMLGCYECKTLLASMSIDSHLRAPPQVLVAADKTGAGMG